MSGTDPAPARVAPPTRLPAIVTAPMSLLYRLGINHRNRRFDRAKGVTRLDRPVVSIGNLSTGGTGKTPMVHWVARELIAMGHHPAIAMRGYKAPPGQPSDEQLEHMEALPSVPVVAGPDRIAGLRRLLASDAGKRVDRIILDDGFQHRQIARDLDIVLIDATAPPARDALLPMGHLREPASSLRRADAIVITRRELVNAQRLAELERWLDSVAPDCPRVVASHRWTSVSLYSWSDGAWHEQISDPSVLTGKAVLGVCAIGNPEGFYAMLGAHKARVVDRLTLPDHARYTPRVAQTLYQQAQQSGTALICMTAKDWVKAAAVLGEPCPCPVAVPRLGLDPGSGAQALRSLLGEISRPCAVSRASGGHGGPDPEATQTISQ